MRASIIAAAIALALGTGSAVAATHHHHAAANATAAPASNIAAELAARDKEIAELKSALTSLEAKVDALETHADEQSVVNVATAKDVETLQAKTAKVDKLDKLVNDTTIGGRVFLDVSDIEQKKNGVKTANSGDGLDVKRGYFTVNHAFNEIWSASLTTDFNFVNDPGAAETQLFIKNLYLQGKFSDAFAFRAGAIPMAWTPYVENFYGYRYVENTLTDRQKVANTADWGLSANGKLGDGMVDYAAAVVNGGGYKNPTRTDRMDFEGRIGFSPIKDVAIAIGGYSGDLGKETATNKTLNTASRGDAMIAYAKGNNRIGAEYFTASNWTPAANLIRDKSDGYSFWASYGFTDVFSVFGRYDHVNPSKDIDPTLRDKYYNLGLQWDVRKGVKLAAVYKNDDLKDKSNDQKTQEFGIFGDLSF